MKLICIFLFIVPFVTIGQISGKVTGITDGDTFTLLTGNNQQLKIRLYGIDCPEKGQDYGKQCKLFLSNLIFSKNVQLQGKGFDRYKRTLAIVFINGVNVNEEMLHNGMAWHFIKYDKNAAWDAIQAQAKKQKLGLWSLPNAIAPWEWRKQRK